MQLIFKPAALPAAARPASCPAAAAVACGCRERGKHLKQLPQLRVAEALQVVEGGRKERAEARQQRRVAARQLQQRLEGDVFLGRLAGAQVAVQGLQDLLPVRRAVHAGEEAAVQLGRGRAQRGVAGARPERGKGAEGLPEVLCHGLRGWRGGRGSMDGGIQRVVPRSRLADGWQMSSICDK